MQPRYSPCYCILLSAFAFVALAIPASASPYWARTIGGWGNDIFEDMSQAADGGCVAVGQTDSFGQEEGHWDGLVVKLDASGNVSWQSTFGGPGDDYFTCVQQTSDGGYIVTGWRRSSDTDSDYLWIVRLDSSGRVVWQKTYSESDWCDGRCIRQTSDGGYIVIGNIIEFPGPGWEVWVLKLDAEGGISWQKSYGGPENESGVWIEQTTDGGYVAVSLTSSFGAGYLDDVWVLRLDATGNVIWQRAVTGPYEDYVNCIRQTPDGNFLLAGWTNSFSQAQAAWLVKLDASGSILWQKGFGDEYEATAKWVEPTEDGGYLVSGTTAPTDYYSADGWVIKMDGSGDAVFHKRIGGNYRDDEIKAVRRADGYLLLGETWSYGSGAFDFLALRVSSSWTIDTSCPGLIWDTTELFTPTNALSVPTDGQVGTTHASATAIQDPGVESSPANQIICPVSVPTITRITSRSSKPGSAATIYGSNFSLILRKDVVFFGRSKAKITRATTSVLKVTIPKKTPKGPVGVYVVVDGRASNVVTFIVK